MEIFWFDQIFLEILELSLETVFYEHEGLAKFVVKIEVGYFKYGLFKIHKFHLQLTLN